MSATAALTQDLQATVVDCPAVGQGCYLANRAPLAANPLARLPLGSVRPSGWLGHMLQLMVEGMTGRLPEISGFLADENGWFGTDKEGWEEQPYWFRGFHDLAVLTGEKRLLDIAHRWIEAVLTSQTDEGYFGAACHRLVRGQNGQQICDLWPHMVMLDAVITHHEHTGDERVIPFLTRFFAFCRDLPDHEFMPRVGGANWEAYRQGFGNWKVGIQIKRAGDMLPHIYWLYNHTGESWLLDVATRFFQHILPPEDENLDRHIVHFTQRFSYPGIYSQQSCARWRLEQTEFWYAQHMAIWGQQPRGIFGADECVRPGKTDPRHGFETCGMVEFAKSFYLLGRITGNPLYADRTEDVMLNHFPASQPPDQKGLHYLTAANLPHLDASSNHDFFNEDGERDHPQLPYSPHCYRCCQHNVAMGWPWYVQNLWQATADGGLTAWMYGASEVTAKVGKEGQTITLKSESDYPFRDGVELTVAGTARFPLYLRVPRWCEGMRVSVNDRAVDTEAKPGAYLCLQRAWQAGDRVTIRLPMQVSITEWPRTGSVTVDRGPLSYSVRIEEAWREWKEESRGAWKAWEVLPQSPWNYGLVMDRENPAASLQVTEPREPADQPWTVDSAPVEIRAQAKRIPNWQLEEDQTVQNLQPSPIVSDAPQETISLIPLGCARLRISCLPVIGEDADAHDWEPPTSGV